MSILSKIKEAYLERKISEFFGGMAFLSLLFLILNTFLLDLVDTKEYFFTPIYMIGLSILFSIGTRRPEKVFETEEEIEAREARDEYDEQMARMGIPTGTNSVALGKWGYDM
jgi:hypothetical protein